MAALKQKENTAIDQIVLQSAILPRLLNAFFSLIWVVFVFGGFLLPMILNADFDWLTFLIFGGFALVTLGIAVWVVLANTTVTIDRTARTIVHRSNLATLALRSFTLAFGDLDKLQVEFYRQSSGRYSHDAWRLAAVTRDLRRIVINWDGKQNEMMDLGQRVAEIAGVPLVDQSAKPVSGLQKLFDTLRGETTPTNSAPPVIEPAPSAIETPTPETFPSNDAPGPELATTPVVDLKSLSIDQLEKRIAADEMDADARYALARKYHARGQIDPAIKMYQEVLRLDPTNTGAQNNIGVAYQARGKRTEAEAAYRRAIALDPFSFIAHLNLALLLRATNRAAEASQEFYQARQNARGKEETQLAEAASSGGRVDAQFYKA